MNHNKKKLPAEPFWTARGVAFAMHKYRRKNVTSPGRNDYEHKIRNGGTGLYPYKSSARKALSRLDYTITTVPIPLAKPWGEAEVIYLQERHPQYPVRLLAARLGRSVRAVRRKLRHLQLMERGVDISVHLLDELLSIQSGATASWLHLHAESLPLTGYCNEDTVQAMLLEVPEEHLRTVALQLSTQYQLETHEQNYN